MKPVYIVGTERSIGKTTMSLGLLNAFRARGLKTGYIKPLGQRFQPHEGILLHDDARLVASCFGLSSILQVEMPIPIGSGRVEKTLYNMRADELIGSVVESYHQLAKKTDVVVIEGMGHVAMGACIGVSAPEVCKKIDAKALLISSGGIGKTIDEIALCSTYLSARGADMIGVIVNKVWQEKFDRVKSATTKGLANIGIHSFGAVPYREILAKPTMRQVHEELGGELLGDGVSLQYRVENVIIGAMEPHHMVSHLKPQTLIILPGDRNDSILALIESHLRNDKSASPLISGLVLTGGFRPEKHVIEKIKSSLLPVIIIEDDTFSTAAKLKTTIFKISPDDRERIDQAISLVTDYVDVDAILEKLK